MAASIKDVWDALDLTIDWTVDPVRVTYEQIKKVGGEPRLAAKFDSSRVLPDVLKREDRFVMPTADGYLLHKGRSAGYVTFPESVDKTVVLSADPRDLFTFGPGTSEHAHLRYAYRQGVFADALSWPGQLWESWSGRRRVGAVHYRFAQSGPFHLDGRVQIEIDLGLALESIGLALIEGKTAGAAADFNARQLFLPYLDALTRSPKTPVRPLFFEIQEPGIYIVHEYAFGDDDITSIQHRRSVKYLLAVDTSHPYVPGDTLEIPQADRPDTILAAIEAIASGSATAAAIAESLGFDSRQGSYYANAARTLGLARHGDDRSTWVVTRDGEAFVLLGEHERREQLAKRIAQVWLVDLYRSYLDEEEGGKAVAAACESAGLGAGTARRRLGTIRAWSRWRP